MPSLDPWRDADRANPHGSGLTLRREPRDAAPVAAALATAETLTALLLAHGAAGGTLPDAGSLIVLAALVYGAGLVVLGRSLPIRYAAPGLVLVQVVLHGWLNAMAPAAEHAAHTAHVVGPAGAAPLGLSWPMLLAHAVAGACAALSWGLRRRAVAVLVSWTDPAVAGPHPAPRLRAPRTTRLAPALRHVAVAPTRGPPVVPLPA
ncbi:cell division protein FtsQ [Nocardioides sambongensis]|uniref:cell division protein FtsQ n=1 Tax=Nocardioides sambongensis TaxID=2589074 RepID=UPI00112729A9|nr:cell division protein FtsQ [Nocardioides sambongensis]